MEKEIELIEVFSGTSWQIGMVNTLLENAGIKAFIKDDIMGTFNPWWTAGCGGDSITLCVGTDDYEKVIQIAMNYDNNSTL